MSKGRNKEFVNPTGLSQISSIFLAIVRIVLGIYLLYTDPLSFRFRYLLIILFLISVSRHLLFYFSKPKPDNIYNFLLDLVTPCLYGFILFHILSIYQSAFLSLAVSIFLPAIIYCFLFGGDPVPVMSKGIFFSGLLCYVLTFLLAVNYTFDTSTPSVEKYFLANKYYTTAAYEYGTEGGNNYYFDLIHVDSISSHAQWVEVNQKTYGQYRSSQKYKRMKFGEEEFMILGRKETPFAKRQYYFLLQEVNGPFEAKHMEESEYSRFEEGDTFHIEEHKGFLGIGWVTYR
ncbi:hypothetical protein QFZ51_006177 [Chitinophaga sp. W3I9]|uniref:hypothetical protein n=1 Tax=unclassified Chitinophaga TaxID=2619133 RepID=UPI003D1FFF8B